MKKDYLDKLTPEEKFILKDKGTEQPFTGKYNDLFREGIYVCKACGLKLFESNSKFNSSAAIVRITILNIRYNRI